MDGCEKTGSKEESEVFGYKIDPIGLEPPALLEIGEKLWKYEETCHFTWSIIFYVILLEVQ